MSDFQKLVIQRFWMKIKTILYYGIPVILSVGLLGTMIFGSGIAQITSMGILFISLMLLFCVHLWNEAKTELRKERQETIDIIRNSK